MITLSKQEEDFLTDYIEKEVEKMVEKIRNDYIINNSGIIYYIKFGFQEPTVFLGLVELFGKIYYSFTFPINGSLSDIVEVAKLAQKNALFPTSFVLESNSSAKEFQDAGINVSIATKEENEEYREILKTQNLNNKANIEQPE